MSLAAAILLAATFTRPLERVTTMDPAKSTSIYDCHAIALVYETPLAVDYKARPYKLVPGYCELPALSTNGTVYTFKTRSGPAEDMVRSLERLNEPGCPNGWVVKDVSCVRALDACTVEVVLKRRVRYFPWLMAHSASSVLGPNGEGTGPYRLTSWWKNHEMVFERRGARTAKGFDTVRFLVIDDLSTQWLMFLRGEIDFLGDISRDNWDAIVGPDGRIDRSLEAKGVALHSIPTLESLHLGINMRDPVLGPNRKLRQALNCAFDFPEWEKFYNGRIVIADGPVPNGVPERIEEPFAYRYDLEKARRLLAEAGYPEGVDPKTGRRLVLRLAIGRPDQASRESGELTAAFYAKIGIRLELDYMTWDAFLKAVNDGRVQMFRMGWVGDYPDVQNFMQLFYSKNVSPGCNHSNYSNPDFDAAYEREDFKTCQEIVREDCPWVFTHYNRAFSLVSPRVGNYVPSDFPYGYVQFYEAVEDRTKER